MVALIDLPALLLASWARFPKRQRRKTELSSFYTFGALFRVSLFDRLQIQVPL